MINFRSTNRLHYLNSSIEVAQRLPAGADDWFLAGGAPMPVAVYNVREGGSLAGSYINVVNPGTFNAAPGVAPTWSGATGWGFNGTTQWLDTGIVPATANYSALVRFNQSGGGALQNVLGAVTEPSGAIRRFLITPRYNTNDRVYGQDGVLVKSGGAITGPHVMGFAGITCYLDGVNDGSMNQNITPTTRSLYIGAMHFSDTRWFFSGSILYIAIYNDDADHATWVPQVSAAVALL